MIGALLKKVFRKKLGQGAKTGSSFWLTIGAISLLRRGYKRLGRKQERVAFGHKVRPGEEVIMRHSGPPARAVRKDRRKAGIMAAVSSAAELFTGNAARAENAARAAELEAKRLREEAKVAGSRSIRRKAIKTAVKTARRAYK